MDTRTILYLCYDNLKKLKDNGKNVLVDLVIKWYYFTLFLKMFPHEEYREGIKSLLQNVYAIVSFMWFWGKC